MENINYTGGNIQKARKKNQLSIQVTAQCYFSLSLQPFGQSPSLPMPRASSDTFELLQPFSVKCFKFFLETLKGFVSWLVLWGCHVWQRLIFLCFPAIPYHIGCPASREVGKAVNHYMEPFAVGIKGNTMQRYKSKPTLPKEMLPADYNSLIPFYLDI